MILYRVLQIAAAAAFLVPRIAEAQTQFVDFENGIWDHGGSTSTGWGSGELAGTYTMDDGNVVTITVGFAGSATAAAGNLSIINESYFTGFAFQMDPASNHNPASFVNYERIDLEFLRPVTIAEFGLTDVDRDTWDDVVFAEAWANGGSAGTLGTGTASSYAFRSPTNLGLEQIGGLSQVVVASGGSTVNGSESELFIDFSQPVDAMSIYYSNGDFANSASTQTIGLYGNGFTVTTVPEPSAGLMLAVAGGLLLLRRRRCHFDG